VGTSVCVKCMKCFHARKHYEPHIMYCSIHCVLLLFGQVTSWQSAGMIAHKLNNRLQVVAIRFSRRR
jgi:hypothetical protein